ncbi:MAG: YncE family protein [Erythrobacter sp.]
MVKLAAALIALSPLLTACATAQESKEPVASSDVTGTLFVANKFGNTLSKIDLATGEEVLRLDSCTNPHELATAPDGEHVALACYGGTTVDVFRTDTLERVHSLDLGANARPHGIIWHESGAIYVTAEGQQAIYKIPNPIPVDPQMNQKWITGKEGSHMIAVAPDESAAWTTDLGSKTVTRINLRNSDTVSVVVGEEPEGIWLAPDGSALWVSARGSNQAFELDPTTMEIRNTVDTGRFPLRLAIRPQGDVAVTSDLMDGGLSVIDLQTARVVRQIAVSSPEEAEERFQVTILWSDDGSKIYVAETASDTVAEVDYATGEVLRRLAVGDGGDGLAILP